MEQIRVNMKLEYVDSPLLHNDLSQITSKKRAKRMISLAALGLTYERLLMEGILSVDGPARLKAGDALLQAARSGSPASKPGANESKSDLAAPVDDAAYVPVPPASFGDDMLALFEEEFP